MWNVKTFEFLSNGKDLGREKKYTNSKEKVLMTVIILG